jgi:hypothetical protein
MIDLWGWWVAYCDLNGLLTVSMLCSVAVLAALMYTDMRVYGFMVKLTPKPLAAKIVVLNGYCNTHPKGRVLVLIALSAIAAISLAIYVLQSML